LTKTSLVAFQKLLPRLGVLVARIKLSCRARDVLIGRVGAADPPQAEVGADDVPEALEPALKSPLPSDREVGVSGHRDAIQRGAVARATEQEVAVRVAHPEGGHRRTSTTCPSSSSSTSQRRSPERIR